VAWAGQAEVPPIRACILIAEDDIIVREIVAAYLRNAGINVALAATAATAAAAARQQPFDIVVLGVNLPDGTGFDLGSQLRRNRDMPIIYMTARGAVEDRLKGFQTGGDDYLVKPIDERELLARIRAFLRRRISFSPFR
jgi:DNA-binding response OmpR family regulator